LGRSQRSEVKNLVRNIVMHLIKLAYSPATANWFGWESEIRVYRGQLEGVLDNSPSLRPSLPDVVSQQTPRGVRIAVSELRKFREMDAAAAVERTSFSFTPDQILDPEWFLPGTYERVVEQLKRDGQR